MEQSALVGEVVERAEPVVPGFGRGSLELWLAQFGQSLRHRGQGQFDLKEVAEEVLHHHHHHRLHLAVLSSHFDLPWSELESVL